MSFALHAAHFVLPGRYTQTGYLEIDGGKFVGFSTEAPAGAKIVELGDAIVGPGLVDTHIHGYFGHATTDVDPEGLLEASLELAKRGTTSWLPTTFTDDTERIAQQCEAIAKAKKLEEKGELAAHIQGIYLEGPFFTFKHKGAQNPKYLMAPSYDIFAGWQKRSGGLIVKSALAAEYAGSVDYISKLEGEGVVTCIGHSDATFAEAIAAVQAGARVFVHTYNGMSGLHHREPGIVGCAMSTKDTFAELICDGKHVVPGACEALVRAKGYEHVVLVTDCLACGGLPDGNYTSGGLDVVLKDGLCYLSDMSSIAGSVLNLAQGVKNMVDWGIVTADEAIRMASEVAAKSAAVESTCGLIIPGRAADLTIFNPDMTLNSTYVSGNLVK